MAPEGMRSAGLPTAGGWDWDWDWDCFVSCTAPMSPDDAHPVMAPTQLHITHAPPLFGDQCNIVQNKMRETISRLNGPLSEQHDVSCLLACEIVSI